jgi:hypothetical protein
MDNSTGHKAHQSSVVGEASMTFCDRLADQLLMSGNNAWLKAFHFSLLTTCCKKLSNVLTQRQNFYMNSFPLSTEEFRAFIGIVYLMGVLRPDILVCGIWIKRLL